MNLRSPAPVTNACRRFGSVGLSSLQSIQAPPKSCHQCLSAFWVSRTRPDSGKPLRHNDGVTNACRRFGSVGLWIRLTTRLERLGGSPMPVGVLGQSDSANQPNNYF